jgi:hypothetical protein
MLRVAMFSVRFFNSRAQSRPQLLGRCAVRGPKGLLVIVASSVVAVVAADARSAVYYFGGTGHSYEVVSLPSAISWSDAKLLAEDSTYLGVHGYLVTITSAEENTFVTGLIGTGCIPGGGYQPPGSPEPDGNWQWVTGEPWGYTNWRLDEPNNSQGVEHVLEVDGLTSIWNGGWNDLPDAIGWTELVVEYNAVPEPASMVVWSLLGVGGWLGMRVYRRRAR